MSWRLIFAVLLIAAGASAWGGLRLGDWLIAHGPAQPVMPAHPELEPVPVLGADGKPFVATAPQPLPDGRLGVPLQTPPVNWEIQTVPLMDSAPPIALATTTITMDEAIALASQNQQNGLEGIATVDTIQPVDITTAPPPPPAAGQPAAGNWQAAFQQELALCEQKGFFSRPSCAWAARNKYCEPNNAWGRVDGCPARNSGY
ncbi:hypothetical protein [Castellaniella sp. S9]|uniref:hypothetical protein n=1 Tax=Castellaniella sp. S9 TaxID=2993652 RepID=UPI0022B5DB7C|nr:hypothetical protein [Castellaniella sp. S9]